MDLFPKFALYFKKFRVPTARDFRRPDQIFMQIFVCITTDMEKFRREIITIWLPQYLKHIVCPQEISYQNAFIFKKVPYV